MLATITMLNEEISRIRSLVGLRVNMRARRCLMYWLAFAALPISALRAQERSSAAVGVRVQRERSDTASVNAMVHGAVNRAAEAQSSSRIPWVLLGAGSGAILGGVIGHNRHVEASTSNPDSSLSGASRDLNTAVGSVVGALLGATIGYVFAPH